MSFKIVKTVCGKSFVNEFFAVNDGTSTMLVYIIFFFFVQKEFFVLDVVLK